MRKNVLVFLGMVCISMVVGCTSIAHKVESIETTHVEEFVETSNQLTIEEEKPIMEMEEVDYSTAFNGINGCAVIYNSEENYYKIYNEDMAQIEVSPLSTFKIVATLIGLKHGVIIDENSTMTYNGNQYPIDAWNGNLSLKEAFQSSCVWYFRQVIDAVGQEEVQRELETLNYGNCDVSEWMGTDINQMKELNGFWLASSLLISPMEQIQVLQTIFKGNSQFSQKQIETLKGVMLYDACNDYEVYGKTGTGKEGEAWYVGVAEKNGQREYFAVYLKDEQNKDKVAGSLAREIVNNIFSQ